MVVHSIFCRVESEDKVNQLSSTTTMMVSLERMRFENIFEVSDQSFDFFRINYGETSSVFKLLSWFKNQLKVVKCFYILYDIGNKVWIFYEIICSIYACLINGFLRLRIPRIASFIDLQLSFFLLYK